MNDAHFSGKRFGKLTISRKIGAMIGPAFSAVICVTVVLWLQASSDGLFFFEVGDQDALAEVHGVAAGKNAQDRLSQLAAEGVRVVDQDGRLLDGKESPPENYLASNQLEYKKNIEEHLTQRIINILTPVVGSNGMRVQLSADVDFTQPEVGVSGLKNEQTAEEKINQAGKPVWADAIGIQPAPAGAALDKTISDKSLSTWNIHRLTVAVVLDDRHIVDTGGKIKTLAYTPEAINQFSELVKQAAGIDGARGDKVTIQNVAFRPTAEIKSGPLIPVWERAWFSDLIKRSIAVVTVIFLLFGVLRPAARGLLNRGAEEEKPANQAATEAKHAGVTGRDGASVDIAGSILGSAEQNSANHAFSPFTAARGYPKSLQDLQSLVDENPKLVAQIIQSWIRDEPIR